MDEVPSPRYPKDEQVIAIIRTHPGSPGTSDFFSTLDANAAVRAVAPNYVWSQAHGKVMVFTPAAGNAPANIRYLPVGGAMRFVLASVLFICLSISAKAMPGLLAANPKTMDGVWEWADFGGGRFYRLEVNVPEATLIVACPKMEGSDFIFETSSVSITNGTIDFDAREKATGMEMHVHGTAKANDAAGIATLSLHVRENASAPILKAWNERSREFWKRENVSKMEDLIAAGKRAEELSRRLRNVTPR